jgi:uncharacterized membrane protein YfcA
MRHPERNRSPVVTSIAVVGISILVLPAAGALLGVNPRTLGGLAASLVIAGVILGAWASQAASWTQGGYAWRLGVAWLVVLTLGLFCGVFSVDAPG